MASNDEPYRRRGRPTGKNRAPLSLDERRARNAQYERERRYETSEAMSQLAAAAGCEPELNNAEILATVISQLQRASQLDPSDDIAELRRINEKLMKQIESIEQRLSNWEGTQGSEQITIADGVANDRKRRGKQLAKSSKRKKNSENSMDVTLTPPSDNF